MIRRATARSLAPHLSSALIACALTAAILCGGRLLAMHLEERTIHSIAPRDFFIKNQGLAFERAAARCPRHLASLWQLGINRPNPQQGIRFLFRDPPDLRCVPWARRHNFADYFAKAGRTGLRVAWPKDCDLAIGELVFNACPQAGLLRRKLLVNCGKRHSFWQCT